LTSDVLVCQGGQPSPTPPSQGTLHKSRWSSLRSAGLSSTGTPVWCCAFGQLILGMLWCGHCLPCPYQPQSTRCTALCLHVPVEVVSGNVTVDLDGFNGGDATPACGDQAQHPCYNLGPALAEAAACSIITNSSYLEKFCGRKCLAAACRDFKQAIQGAFFTDKQFNYQLTAGEARKLCDMFSKSATQRLYQVSNDSPMWGVVIPAGIAFLHVPVCVHATDPVSLRRGTQRHVCTSSGDVLQTPAKLQNFRLLFLVVHGHITQQACCK